MRLSRLLAAEVVDASGTSIGKVHDVRLVPDGPVLGAFGPAYRVEALIVGGASIGTRLGFDRSNVKGPLPLRWLFGRLARRGKQVPWDRVAAIEEGRVRLRVKEDALEHVTPLDR